MSKVKKALLLSLTISLSIIGLTTAITTLIFMGHNGHWEIAHDELVAAPLIVVGFGTALTMFIVTCCISSVADGS